MHRCTDCDTRCDCRSDCIEFCEKCSECQLYENKMIDNIYKELEEPMSCQSNSDGECFYPDCPQIRDNEPQTTKRSCPLYDWSNDNNRF